MEDMPPIPPGTTIGNQHKRTCFCKNLEAENSVHEPPKREPKEAKTGNPSYIIGYILFDSKNS